MKKFFQILAAVLVLLVCFYVSYHVDANTDILDVFDVEEITIWYNDPALTDFLNSSALAFKDQENIRVTTVLYDGMGYFDAIYEASLSGEKLPDLYITDTSMLEEAVMLGIAHPARVDQEVLTDTKFPKVALSAVTYHNTYFGYPFSYDTAFLLYNANYLAQMAAENGLSGVDLVPATIEDLKAFADVYTSPEGVENFFIWDASDVFYNYFFAGRYMTVCGENGDDKTQINLYNPDALACLQVYQELNEYFSFDAESATMENIMANFLSGKIIYTIATADALSKIEEATLNGEFEYSYGIAMLPGIDAEHPALGLSVTDCLVVNGFSEHKTAADAFAAFVSTEMADNLYSRTGKLPCVNVSAEHLMEVPPVVRSNYLSSTSLPKIVELENYWMQLELFYSQIWNGEPTNKTLLKFNENIKTALGITQTDEDAETSN